MIDEIVHQQVFFVKSNEKDKTSLDFEDMIWRRIKMITSQNKTTLNFYNSFPNPCFSLI